MTHPYGTGRPSFCSPVGLIRYLCGKMSEHKLDPPPSPGTRVFVSYAHDAKTAVEQVLDRLKGGLYIFTDRDIAGGEDFIDRLEQEIADAHCVLLFCSSAARKSDWVKREVRAAQARKLVVIPVALDDTEPFFELGSIHHEDLRGGLDATRIASLRTAMARAQAKVGPPNEVPTVDAEVTASRAPWRFAMVGGVLVAGAIGLTRGEGWAHFDSEVPHVSDGATTKVAAGDDPPSDPMSDPESDDPAPSKADDEFAISRVPETAPGEGAKGAHAEAPLESGGTNGATSDDVMPEWRRNASGNIEFSGLEWRPPTFSGERDEDAQARSDVRRSAGVHGWRLPKINELIEAQRLFEADLLAIASHSVVWSESRGQMKCQAIRLSPVDDAPGDSGGSSQLRRSGLAAPVLLRFAVREVSTWEHGAFVFVRELD